eukprot:3282769-Prymnesium_polylepis.1
MLRTGPHSAEHGYGLYSRPQSDTLCALRWTRARVASEVRYTLKAQGDEYRDYRFPFPGHPPSRGWPTGAGV